MSKRKGMSLEEKRDKLLEVFHESRDVYMLKDVEKLGSKKGIVLQTVKEVLQSLLDDDLVIVEKIGASNFYWSFPSEASCKINNEVSQKEHQQASLKRRRAELQATIDKEKVGKEDSPERAELLSALALLREEMAGTQAKIAAYSDADPETIARMTEGAEVAKASANRWLDNIEVMLSWTKKKCDGCDEGLKKLCEENGYTEDMDYLP